MTLRYPQLYETANRSGTDKGHIGPGERWSANNYTDIYQAYFGRQRFSVQHFCEVGLGVTGPNWESRIAQGSNEQGGGSMRMWYEFFPNARLYGLDINPAGHLDNDRVSTFQIDQGDIQSLEAFKRDVGDVAFDIVIDDGSHIADHQQLTLSLLWEKLKPGGLYVIEDLNDQELGAVTHVKHAPRDAVSTRKLFRDYVETGTINPRNQFADTAFFDEIEYVALHSFPVTVNLRDIVTETARIVLGRGGKGMLRHEYVTRSPKLVVLQKTGSRDTAMGVQDRRETSE